MLKVQDEDRPGRGRKKLLDGASNPSRGDLGGFTFQIITPDGTPVGEPLTMNSHGHAPSDEIDTGDYKLAEPPPRPPQPQMNLAAPQDFALESAPWSCASRSTRPRSPAPTPARTPGQLGTGGRQPATRMP